MYSRRKDPQKWFLFSKRLNWSNRGFTFFQNLSPDWGFDLVKQTYVYMHADSNLVARHKHENSKWFTSVHPSWVFFSTKKVCTLKEFGFFHYNLCWTMWMRKFYSKWVSHVVFFDCASPRQLHWCCCDLRMKNTEVSFRKWKAKKKRKKSTKFTVYAERNLKMRTEKKYIGVRKKSRYHWSIFGAEILYGFIIRLCVFVLARKSCEQVIAGSADAGEFKIGNLFYDFRGVIKTVSTTKTRCWRWRRMRSREKKHNNKIFGLLNYQKCKLS